MCLIVDANLAAIFFGEPPNIEFKPAIDWLTSPKSDGKLVVGGDLATELNVVNKARRFVKSLFQAGRARFIPISAIIDETSRIRTVCVSDDPQVIALARISGARVLCSRDHDLHRDFTNNALVSDPRGVIYQNSKHKHLLRLYGHTKACKRSAERL